MSMLLCIQVGCFVDPSIYTNHHVYIYILQLSFISQPDRFINTAAKVIDALVLLYGTISLQERKIKLMDTFNVNIHLTTSILCR